MKKKLNKKILKKPKYKIDDVIVYRDRYSQNSLIEISQSKIVEAYGLWESGWKNDSLTWSYITELSNKNEEDSLQEEDILYKL